jgi:ATPase family associated with various cellular activities (AAA)
LTAESVAEFTQKPLITINIGEMSVEPDVEKRLKTVFRQASVWDAVLLLDEADVVLEERSYEDMKRNAIVSGEQWRVFHWQFFIG